MTEYEPKKGKRERFDTFVSRVTGNRIRREHHGAFDDLDLSIHQRRRGRQTEAMTPYDGTPVSGKTHDIVYARVDGKTTRSRLKNLRRKLLEK